MKVVTDHLEFQSKGENHMIDLTVRVQEAIARAGLTNGLATLFVVGSTAAVTTIENEPGLLKIFPAMLERGRTSRSNRGNGCKI